MHLIPFSVSSVLFCCKKNMYDGFLFVGTCSFQRFDGLLLAVGIKLRLSFELEAAFRISATKNISLGVIYAQVHYLSTLLLSFCKSNILMNWQQLRFLFWFLSCDINTFQLNCVKTYPYFTWPDSFFWKVLLLQVVMPNRVLNFWLGRFEPPWIMFLKYK